ncbi:MAG: hypothetical protein WBJ50_04765, partial [Smithellaceae bacterium]
LREAMKAFSIEEAFILTNDEEKELVFDGTKIRTIPVWKWLLGKIPNQKCEPCEGAGLRNEETEDREQETEVRRQESGNSVDPFLPT